MATPTFEFSTDSYPADFIVVSFIGNEEMSRLFKYEIEVKIHNDADIDENAILDENAIFKFLRSDDDDYELDVSGVLSSFNYLRSAAGYDYYLATLVPGAWEQSLGCDYEIYKDLSPKEILQEEIDAAGLNADVSGIVEATMERNFVCQYRESNFNFISRLAEHYGIYYYFDHAPDNDSAMIYADDLQYPACAHPDLDFDSSVSGDQFYNTVSKFTTINNKTASFVNVRDVNPAQPSNVITADAGTDDGSGTAINLVNENVFDSTEADYIAKIRFEEISCNKTIYEMQSGAVQLRPGYTFSLNSHPKANFNKEYLVVSVIHEGNALDETSKQHDDRDLKKNIYYKNTLKAIDSSVQFRPKVSTPVPAPTTTTGFVYSEASNPRSAERDKYGRYRVRFKFINDPDKDKSSYWLRMAQPASGAEDTLDIPLKGGVEVQIGFVDGNADKPYILASLPNGEFPSFVTARNPQNALMYSSGLLGLKANGGSYRYFCVEEKDPANPEFNPSDPDNDQIFPVMSRPEDPNNPGQPDPNLSDVIMSSDSNLLTSDQVDVKGEHEMSGFYNIYRSYGDTYRWVNGNTYQWDNERYYSYGNDYEEVHEDQDPGYVNDEKFDMNPLMQAYTPKGRRHDDTYDYSTWQDGGDGLVEKNWGDKCEYHYGKAFNWSGGRGPGGSLQEYNYGNGYTENLINSDRGTLADISGAHHSDMYKQSAATPSLEKLDNIFPPNPYVARDYTSYFDTDMAGSGHPAAYELTDGNTYSYQNGFTLEVHNGDSDSWTHGTAREWVNGNTCEWINGDSRSDILGSTTDMQAGNANSLVGGETNDVFVGAKSETTVAGVLEIALSATVKLGAVAEKDLQVQKQSASEKKEEAAIKKLVANMQSTEDALKKLTNSIDFEVKSVVIKLDAAAISFKALVINHTAALTKIG